jgi:HK97 family phage major capsid protein
VPAYNNIISRSDVAALIPEDVSADIIGHVVSQSAALSLFRHVPMSRAQQRMPVIAALPVAYFVNPSDSGLKQTTEADWANKYLNAEEIAAIVPIPEAVLDDTAFDVWAAIRPLLEEAIGRCLDAAVFFGTGKPASWPAAIIPSAIAAGNVAVEGTNDQAHGGVVGDLSAVFGTVEADGYDVNGIVANRLLRGKLRNARATTGEQLADVPSNSVGTTPASEVYGVPITYPLRGLWPTGAGAAEAVVGDFSEGILGVRQDITYKLLDQAVIQDGTGAIQFNLAQQDMVAMRVVARFGFQVKSTLTYEQPTDAQRYPFGVLNAA